jgi:hypothetical protein
MDLESTASSSKRVFTPLYVATGDMSKDKLAFIHTLERLKVRIIILYESFRDAMEIIFRLKSGLDGLITM